jgi:hypothetical protein
LYNSQNIPNNGSISLSINANDFFGSSYDNYETNFYSIDYYYIPPDSNTLKSLYLGSNLIKNTNDISNIPNGFYIIQIKDQYNNMPINITNNGNTISYDNHFVEAKKVIQNYNSKVLSLFNYGDILVNINSDSIIYSNIPSNTGSTQLDLPDKSITAKFYFVQQQISSNNNGTIYVELATSNITCYIYGPKNYFKKFTSTSTFTDLIPGIYTIMGDEQDLKKFSLYQNQTRVLLEKGYLKEIFLSFVSYNDLVSIKDN